VRSSISGAPDQHAWRWNAAALRTAWRTRSAARVAALVQRSAYLLDVHPVVRAPRHLLRRNTTCELLPQHVGVYAGTSGVLWLAFLLYRHIMGIAAVMARFAAASGWSAADISISPVTISRRFERHGNPGISGRGALSYRDSCRPWAVVVVRRDANSWRFAQHHSVDNGGELSSSIF